MSGITRPRFRWENHTTMVPNAWARDNRITNRARGLLVQLMSHSPGWVTSVAQLVASNQEGKDAIKTDLNALVAAGYLRRVDAQRDDDGRYGGLSWEVSDPFDEGGQSALDQGGPAALVDPPPKKNNSKKNPLPPSGVAPPSKPKPSRRAASRPLPDDWAPTEAHREQARAASVDVDVEAAKMRDWYLSKDGRYVDWDAVFRNWVRKAGDDLARRAPAAPPGGSTLKGDEWMSLPGIGGGFDLDAYAAEATERAKNDPGRGAW